jgi:hypothetical protein
MLWLCKEKQGIDLDQGAKETEHPPSILSNWIERINQDQIDNEGLEPSCKGETKED